MLAETLGPVSRVVLLVNDFAASLRFYRDVLGLPLEGHQSTTWASLRAGPVLICLHGGWEGMPFRREDFGRSPDELLFLVSDCVKSRADLIARGVAVAEIHRPGPGLSVAEFADPDGRRLAIEERSVRA